MLSGTPQPRGDTIVEVLLAIAIAALAIGFTYATAQHSLNQAVAAREHNQALNIIQNQLTDLDLRFKKSPSATVFNNNFGSSKNHFCLDDSATAVSSGQPWTPYFNDSSVTESSPLLGGGNPYNSSSPNACERTITGEGAKFYIDIQTTTLSGITQNPTVYQVFVRWERQGGGRNQASVYYRLNGASGQKIGFSGYDIFRPVIASMGTKA